MCRSVETPSVLRVHATLAQGPSEALRKGVTIPPNFRVVAAFVFSIRLNSQLFALTGCIPACARTTTAFGLFQSTMSRHARESGHPVVLVATVKSSGLPTLGWQTLCASCTNRPLV